MLKQKAHQNQQQQSPANMLTPEQRAEREKDKQQQGNSSSKPATLTDRLRDISSSNNNAPIPD